jgi:hypothetical protein
MLAGMANDPTTQRRTLLGHSSSDKAFLFGAFPLIGLVLGFFLPRIADWAAKQKWVPFQGPLELIASWEGWWVIVVCVVVGGIAGVVVGAMALHETLKLTITDEQVEAALKERSWTIARADVDAAFLDGKQVVLQDAGSRELLREKYDAVSKGDLRKVAEAFEAHGYPWREADPHAADFRRWVPDQPELPSALNAVLKAREKSLENGSAEDARELREEAAKLGYVLRDEETRQYWRTVEAGH